MTPIDKGAGGDVGKVPPEVLGLLESDGPTLVTIKLYIEELI